MEPVYLISSFRRSGSSMMARCLHEAGLPIVYTPLNDWQFNIPYGGRGGYVPNPNGFYSIEGYIDYEFPTFYDHYKGKLMKIPRVSLREVPQGKYKVVFMDRPPEEILASMRKFIGLNNWGMIEVSVYLKDQIKQTEYDRLLARGDFEILEIQYHDVIEDPLREFEKIRDFGFPIDPVIAASFVDSKLYRNKVNPT